LIFQISEYPKNIENFEKSPFSIGIEEKTVLLPSGREKVDDKNQKQEPIYKRDEGQVFLNFCEKKTSTSFENLHINR